MRVATAALCLATVACHVLAWPRAASGQVLPGGALVSQGPLRPLLLPPGPDGCTPPDLDFPPPPGLSDDAPADGSSCGDTQLLVLQPVGATHNLDTLNVMFFDLDGTSGLRSYSCDAITYDGHTGHDVAIRSFAYQDAGVPVFAARSGSVLYTHDGEADKNTTLCACEANYVVIDHGDDTAALYWHLRKDSVAVAMGQHVVAGQQLGEVGSSGWCTGPHLHFATTKLTAEKHITGWHESLVGACRPGTSGWIEQEPLFLDTTVLDFGASSTDPGTVEAFPYPPPVNAQIALTDDVLYLWTIVANIPAHDQAFFRFKRPNGTTAWTSATLDLGSGSFLRGLYTWFGFDVDDMHSIAGTWHVELVIDSVVAVDAPVDVVATVDPSFNRPPEPIGVTFEDAPKPQRPLVCRVLTDPVLDDLDWDIVRYHYVWKLNGSVVRDVITGGTRDVLPACTGAAGDDVECAVSAMDEEYELLPAGIRAFFPHDPWLDIGYALPAPGGPPPKLLASGTLDPGAPGQLAMSQMPPFTVAWLPFGLVTGTVPLKGGILVPFPIVGILPVVADGGGSVVLPFVWPAGVPAGVKVVFQAWAPEPAAPAGFVASNGVEGTVP